MFEVAPNYWRKTPSLLATKSKVKMFDLDEDNKAKANVVGHEAIVSLAGYTLHGRFIKEGHESVSVSSIELGAESMLYEGNNDDDPPMVRLGDALKSTTKWHMGVLKTILEECNKSFTIRWFTY